MDKSQKDELSSVLAEWRPEPVGDPRLAAKVLARTRESSAVPGFPGDLGKKVRFAFACLVFGAVSGAAFAEWVSLRQEDLYESGMSTRYLHSIDPTLSVLNGNQSP